MYSHAWLRTPWYDCVRLCRAYVRLCTVMYGYSRLCTAMNGYVWICTVMHGCSFIPRAHFETKVVMVSYYGYEI